MMTTESETNDTDSKGFSIDLRVWALMAAIVVIVAVLVATM